MTNNSGSIMIRNVEISDIPVFFVQQLDPEANRMAAFVRKERHDRAAFDAHWQRIMNTPGIVNKTILCGEKIAGHIACYPQEGQLEITIGLGKNTGARESQPRRSKNCFRELPTDRFSPERRKTTSDRSEC